MNVFLTSATGHLGAAVARAFLDAGHRVSALTRSHDSHARLRRSGITLAHGDLRQPESYVPAAQDADVIVHTAFEYDAEGREVESTDVGAVEALVAPALAPALESRSGHLIYTSSAFLLGGIAAPVIDEYTPVVGAQEGGAWRRALEQRVLSANCEDFATSVIRLGVVYGGNNMTMDEMFSAAHAHGYVTYHGNGADRWPMVYRDDVAELFVRVAERRAPGVFHGVDGHPLPIARIAALASAAAGCSGRTHPVPMSVTRDDGAHARRITYDVPVTTARAEEVGWVRRLPSFERGVSLAYQEWLTARSTLRDT